MSKTVLLFDVDGTLVTTGGAGGRAIRGALEAFGEPAVSGFSYAGMTDRAIVRRHLAEGRQRPAEEVREDEIDDVLERYLDLLSREVASTPQEDYVVHDGMLEALTAAEARPDTAIGLGTGNVERGARIKLGRVGLADRFAFGGFGCDAEDRAALIARGAERGAERLGVPRSACRVVVIGDTPRDVAAALAIGAECLAVATGRHDRETLRASGATYAFDSLAAPEALLALLGG
ncbi:MAG: haloacid dehalogenase-like hydrolase [Myxococcales bacterium]|nr:haloacid dehalogenase-like hydrolase [Myxococcales bacterium]